MRNAALACAVVLGVVAMGGGSRARAQESAGAETPPDAARTLFLDGQSKYRHGDYEGAIQAWQAAYAIDPRPLLRYNMAQAYGRLGRFTDELTELEAYVQTAPADEASLADARARLAALRQRLSSTGIVVEGGPEGARLFVDGQPHGLLPRPDPIAVSPGSHQVTVEAEGYADFTASTSVVAGDRVTVTVQMEATPTGGEPEEPGRTIAPLHIALWAGGGAALVAGAALGTVAFVQASDAFEGSSKATQAHNMAIAADVLIAAGAAAAVTGLVLYLVGVGTDEAPEEASGPTVTAAPTVGVGHAGLAVAGRF